MPNHVDPAAPAPAGRRHDRLRGLVDLVAAVTTTAAAGAILWLIIIPRPPVDPPPRGTRIEPPAELILLKDTATKGNPLAPVAVIEYSDFECTFCGRFAREVLTLLVSEYVDSGRVLFAFKHLPLEKIHQRAVPAATAAECARRQGRFWPMHDRLFSEPRSLDDISLGAHALAAGLDVAVFEACRTGAAEEAVRQDLQVALGFGLRGTPVFLVGQLEAGARVRSTAVLSGLKPVSEFRKVIDDAIRIGSTASLRR